MTPCGSKWDTRTDVRDSAGVKDQGAGKAAARAEHMVAKRAVGREATGEETTNDRADDPLAPPDEACVNILDVEPGWPEKDVRLKLSCNGSL